MSTTTRVAKNTGYLYAKMGITMFISLYTTRLILNSLGASDFGIFNVVGGAISMLGFLNVAMAGATQRFMSYSEGEGDFEKQKQIFNISIVLHAGIAIVVGIVLVGAGYFFFDGVLNIPDNRIFAARVIYGSLIVSTLFTIMSVPYDALLNAHENMRYYAIVGVIESLLKLGVAFVVAVTTSDKLIIYGLLMAVIPLITLSIMRIYCHKKYDECRVAPRRYFSRSVMQEMTGFAGWNFLSSAGSLICNYGQSIVLNIFWGPTLNAAQGIVGQLNGQLMIFSNNLLKAVNPIIVKKESVGRRNEMFYVAFFSTKLSFFLLALLAVPLMIEAPVILKWWLKNIPDWTVVFLVLCQTRSLLEQLYITIASTTLYAQGRIKAICIWNFILNFLTMGVLYTLFSYGFSPVWLYVNAIFIMVVVNGGIRLYYCKKNVGMNINKYLKDVLTPTLLVFIMAYLIGNLPTVFYSGGNEFIRLCMVVVLSTTTLFIGGYCVILSPEERCVINKLFGNLKQIRKQL